MACPQCGTALLVPRPELGVGGTVGGFKLKQLLAETERGKVYLAEQLSLGRDVALKILSADLMGDPESAAAFLAKLRATARLEHPHLVRVYEVGEDGGVYFIAMAHIEGQTLVERLAQRGTMTEGEALDVVQKLAGALGWAWQHHHVIHGDIRPSHILLDRGGGPHLAEMGLADPEVGFRADMFALGLVLYQMITGRTPFESDGTAERALADPRKLNPRISPGCVALLETMLAKQPAHRYESWEEFLKDAARVYKGGKPLRAPPSHGKSMLLREAAAQQPSVKPIPASSKGGLLATVVLVAIVAVVAVLFYTGQLKWSGTSTPTEPVATPVPVAPVPVPVVPTPAPPPPTPPRRTEPVPPVEKKPDEGARRDLAARQEAVRQAMAKLQLDAELFAAQGKFDEAIKELEGYAGVSVVETKEERAALVERLKLDRNKVEAAKKWKKFSVGFAETILRLDWPAVKQQVATVEKDPSMALLDKSRSICEMALKVAAMPELMQASLQGDVGKVVTLAARTGVEQGEVVGIAGGRIQLKKAVKVDGQSSGFVTREVRVSDLTLEEWLRRIGAEKTTERELMCGLLLWQTRDVEKAYATFGRVEHSLGALLAHVMVDKALAKFVQDNPSSLVEFEVILHDGLGLKVKPNEQLTNLSALKGLPLKSLTLLDCKALRDISPLRGMPLEELDLESTAVDNITVLYGMRLRRLNLRSTKVRDLASLKGMPLEELALSFLTVEDLLPLAGAPLKRLWLRNCRNVRDLKPLKDAPLERLTVIGCPADLAPVRGIPTLKHLVE